MSKRKRESQWYLYNFLCDDESSCAVTACLPHARVHVIADATKLDDSSHTGAEYWGLVRKLKSQGNGDWIARKSNETGDQDSGVDVRGGGLEVPKCEEQDDDGDPETALLSWMLSPLLANQDTGTSSKKALKQRNLQDWYRCSTEFYELSISEEDGRLEALELEPSKEMEKEVDSLLPSVTLPKHITDNIDVTHFNASDLSVLECSDQPPGTPYHPCRVQHRRSKQAYFLKVVDNKQPRTTKRELDVLGRMRKLKLEKQMRVPILEGLVSFEDAASTPSGRCKVMGFLQTEIPNPTPLTNLLDPSIPQAKREKWAKEAERMKTILHDNDIIWGDAKADNFMVDADDNLWIIDFGGSYTEGWVDPELKETVEGDDMGTYKTIYALKDPGACTYKSDEEEEQTQGEEQNYKSGQKRKANDDSPAGAEKKDSRKRRRSARLKK